MSIQCPRFHLSFWPNSLNEGLWSRFSALATLYRETSEENAHLKQRIEHIQESREQLQADQTQLQISYNQKIDQLREKYDTVRDQVQDLLAQQPTPKSRISYLRQPPPRP
jgi:septation ring formation regulator EzrA